jgi:hypothetical protein
MNMERLKRWVRENMLYLDWGEYGGMKDISLDDLYELSVYVDRAIREAEKSLNNDK